MLLAASLGYLPTVDSTWQLDVGDKYVSGLAAAPCERLFAVGGVDHVEAFFSESLDDKLADEGVVFDNKDTHRKHLRS